MCSDSKPEWDLLPEDDINEQTCIATGIASLEPKMDMFTMMLRKTKSYFLSSRYLICDFPQVVVVENESFTSRTLPSLLNKLGYTSAVYSTRTQAIDEMNEYWRNHGIDCSDCKGMRLIIIDYNLENSETGKFSLQLKKLISKGELREVPLIACTAYPDIIYSESFKESQFDDVLTKPIGMEKLQAIATQYLEAV